jgi:glucose/arabinose dehydrogenase
VIRRPTISFTLFILLSLAMAACGRTTTGSGLPENQTPIIPQGADTEVSVDTETPTENPTAEPTALPQASFPDPAGYSWNLVIDGFSRPLLATHAGDGSGRIFVVEQDGVIRIVVNGAALPDPFLDISGQVGSESNEQGLLGLAFHLDYESNGLFFINYTDNQGDTVISRFQVSADANIADAGSETILLQVDQSFANHNGGNLEFGPDGFLYAGLGDGGSQGDPNGNGQSLETHLAKLLRIDVNSGDPYAIPADNPYANGGGLPEIWATGLRNPWRFSFDRATGDLYIADVGGSQWEEVDFLPAGTAGGTNFGWNLMEGRHGEEVEGLTGPVAEYEHGNKCSITGGYVYRGQALPAWQGVYLYADFCSGEIFGLVHHADGSWESQLLYDTGFNITSFGQDESGEVYVIDRAGGIYQLQAVPQ